MTQDLSRREEQTGTRKAYQWTIPLALVLGILLIVGVFYFSTPRKAGMDQTTSPGLTQNEEKGAVGPATLRAKESPTYGTYLTDDSGHPLYLFKNDQQAKGSQSAVTKCERDCAKAWPPLMTLGVPKAVSPAQDLFLGTTERRDGSKQVTYNGWPLYRYAMDVGPEKVTGQDVKDFGGEWYLVAPSGVQVNGSEGDG